MIYCMYKRLTLTLAGRSEAMIPGRLGRVQLTLHTAGQEKSSLRLAHMIIPPQSRDMTELFGVS